MKAWMKRAGDRLPDGLRQASKTMAKELICLVQHQHGARQARRYPVVQYDRLHLGCGSQVKAGWLNVDLDSRADVRLDLRRPLPLPRDHFVLIYSEHFLEQIAYPEPASGLVRECYRLLKPGGTFSVVVPDIVLVMKNYFEGGTPEYYQAQRTFHPAWCETQIEHINWNFRQEANTSSAMTWKR
jgi:SAM-dependent methyltransferase